MDDTDDFVDDYFGGWLPSGFNPMHPLDNFQSNLSDDVAAGTAGVKAGAAAIVHGVASGVSRELGYQISGNEVIGGAVGLGIFAVVVLVLLWMLLGKVEAL